MNAQHTGGSAFPSHGSMGEVTHEGMALRDYFAAKAMQGLLELTPQDKQQWTNKMIAETAYGMADAMLKARSNT
jgi:hypothetical protein